MPIYSYVCSREVSELAEGARLLSEYTAKTVSRVQIPSSLPYIVCIFHAISYCNHILLFSPMLVYNHAIL